MRRRGLLSGTLAVLASPGILRAQPTRVLRLIARGDPGRMDAVADPRPEVGDAALLLGDTLYGVDSRLEPRPQLCEGHEVSEDRRDWRFRLRPGLRFHDGAPVLARDAVASLRRWMARDRMGRELAARLDEIAALDDAVFRLRLRTPFFPLLHALAKPDPPLAVIVPERLALLDPAAPLPGPVGCGPLRLVAGDSGPDMAVFERFADYRPRAEAADWLAGGKRVLFERLEWTWPDDPAAAAEALATGAADWWATPPSAQVSALKRNRALAVDVADPLGRVGLLRLDRSAPPFDDVRARRAVLLALGPDACMAALTGGDDALWRAMPTIYAPGTPAAGLAAPQSPPRAADLDGARRLLADAGAAGARVLVSPVGGATLEERAQAGAIVATLQRLGLAAELRPAAPTSQALSASLPGASAATPAHPALDDAGPGAVAAARAAWFEAATPGQAEAALSAVNRAALDDVAFVPTGQFTRYQAWRLSLSGVARAPSPLPWGVQKT